nr:hypothetical protein [Tanacetum cinerariifolium]
IVTSCYATTNNQMRNSSNPRQQAIINEGRVTLQPVQGDKFLLLLVLLGPTHQEQVKAILGNKGLLFVTTTKRKGTCPNSAQNLKGNGMMLGFKDKVLLVQAQVNGQILHEEELAFLADPGIAEGQATPKVI